MDPLVTHYDVVVTSSDKVALKRSLQLNTELLTWYVLGA